MILFDIIQNKMFFALAMAILGCSMPWNFPQEGPERHDSSSRTGKNHEGAPAAAD